MGEKLPTTREHIQESRHCFIIMDHKPERLGTTVLRGFKKITITSPQSVFWFYWSPACFSVCLLYVGLGFLCSIYLSMLLVFMYFVVSGFS